VEENSPLKLTTEEIRERIRVRKRRGSTIKKIGKRKKLRQKGGEELQIRREMIRLKEDLSRQKKKTLNRRVIPRTG